MTADVDHVPSGEQIELRFADQRATVVEVGGGLRTYTAGGRDVLDGYAAAEICMSGRGQVLIPWPNRLQDGAYEFGGQSLQLPLTEPEHANAIHGLVQWVSWIVAERQPHRAVMEHRLHPQPGYPFDLALSIEYVLSGEGLSVTTSATNVGTMTCPFGSGAHPYLTAGTRVVDDAILRVPAATVLRADDRGIPIGAEPLAGTAFDFSRPKSIGSLRLDHAFTDLERDSDNLARVHLGPRSGGSGVVLWADLAYRYLMVFSGDSRPDVNRHSLAVEPMTCPPNAFRTGDDLVHLEPGASFTGSWGVGPA